MTLQCLNNLKNTLYNKIKDPSDIYSAVYPLYRVCNFFGLAPYSIAKSDGKTHFSYSLWPIIKSCALVALFVGIFAFNIYLIKKPFFDNEMTEILRYSQEIFSNLLSICEVIFGCIFAYKMIEAFKKIDEVDYSFKALAVWLPYKKKKIIIYLNLMIWFLGCHATIGFAFYLYTLTEEYSSIIIMIILTIQLPYFINLLMEFQYIHYLDIARERFKLLNEYLETLVQENPLYNGWMEGNVETIATLDEKNETFEEISKSTAAILDPVFVVDQITELHIKLTDTCYLINSAFCFQQLWRITIAFVSIVTALFLIAVNFSGTKQQDGGLKLDMLFTFWAFSNAGDVIVIVWVTSETCKEIDIYSLQMYHNRLHFTVCGLFPLDNTLLYTIAAGVTTYLVILIQFSNGDALKNGHNLTQNQYTT